MSYSCSGRLVPQGGETMQGLHTRVTKPGLLGPLSCEGRCERETSWRTLYRKLAAFESVGGCKNKVHGCLQEIDRDGVNCKHAGDHCKDRKERGEPCHFSYFMLRKTIPEDAIALLTALEIAGMQQSA